MDRLIKRFDGSADRDLMLCPHRGVAYQRNMGRGRIAYDKAYLEHYQGFADSPVERALNAGRLELLARHAHPTTRAKVLDVGVGSGAFVRAARTVGYDARGFDVNPYAVELLKAQGIYAEDPAEFAVATFWDSLEHMEDPELLLGRLRRGSVALVALPVIEDVARVRESKHYKPGEHLYYWTADGFVAWMALYGFRLVDRSDHEVRAGRESIAAFAFVKDLPGYRDYIGLYQALHSARHYGSSATELHLEMVTELVRVNRPQSILDFGCGRSDLASHFYLDGQRRIARYDPAIPGLAEMPEGRFDLVLCCDVLEHIPMAHVDKILQQVKAKGELALFTISMKLAKARLPDGTNAHVTLLTRSEWERWLREIFGSIVVLPVKAPHEANILAGVRAVAAPRHHPCHCGGAVYLDSFNPVKRPVEWFMRCRACRGMGPAYTTEHAARHQWPINTVTRAEVAA